MAFQVCRFPALVLGGGGVTDLRQAEAVALGAGLHVHQVDVLVLGALVGQVALELVAAAVAEDDLPGALADAVAPFPGCRAAVDGVAPLPFTPVLICKALQKCNRKCSTSNDAIHPFWVKFMIHSEGIYYIIIIGPEMTLHKI